jgi:hypothetical protein
MRAGRAQTHTPCRTKVSGWVDLDLPVGEKCSWWRLDGYDTCGSEVEESDADPQAPLGEDQV